MTMTLMTMKYKRVKNDRERALALERQNGNADNKRSPELSVIYEDLRVCASGLCIMIEWAILRGLTVYQITSGASPTHRHSLR